MSYLYVCEQNGIEVLSYTDSAEAAVLENGSGRFMKFVCIQSGHKTKEKIAEALRLHQKQTSFVLLLILVISLLFMSQVAK
jgi:hypothetical protein